MPRLGPWREGGGIARAPASGHSLSPKRFHHEGTKVTKDTKKKTKQQHQNNNTKNKNGKQQQKRRLWVTSYRSTQSFVTFVSFVPSW